ncbi:ZIP zinc/iron transport family [Auricularia subglabra TFB-10046 SS5]|nr:ZIP zinc/iron transport family [Auricularia subglabra TFB-10046 SS5]
MEKAAFLLLAATEAAARTVTHPARRQLADAEPDAEPDECGPANVDSLLGLRIASIFVILLTSAFGALFPVVAARGHWHVHPMLFEFVKFFGSGVIIATAFIHLLAPAIESLGSPCLTGWDTYPWATAVAMLAVFVLFIVELIAYRWGTSKMASLGLSAPNTHGHGISDHSQAAAISPAHGPEPPRDIERDSTGSAAKKEGYVPPPPEDNEHSDASVLAQIVGVAILEFGVVFHSVLIGLALAVDEDFKVLFIVLIFHQMFEGLGLGARLAFLQLPQRYNWVRFAGAALYGLTTPIGIAAGLGVRSTYAPGSATASIVSGIFDAFSAGILLYTGLIELLAHEFLFNPKVHRLSNRRLAFMCGSMILGTGIMSLLGRWA